MQLGEKVELIGTVGIFFGLFLFFIALFFKDYSPKEVLALIFPGSLSVSLFFGGYLLSKGNIKTGLLWIGILWVPILLILLFK